MTAPPPLPGVFADLAPLLNHWGYAAVAGLLFLEDFGVPVPGETVLIAAAVYAGAGQLNVVAVAVIAFLAAVCGDNIGYVIGRYGGHRLVTAATYCSPRPVSPRRRRSSPATAGRSSRSPASSRACARPMASSPD
ncbi:DedA family protein [Streptomyces shenzhenensis]|uniref:DedA family protein n=1 Tax=Streptomyces shenzhenensis TaxID=943815 RepID=UPI00340EB414